MQVPIHENPHLVIINPVEFHNVILLKSMPGMSKITIVSNNPNCSLLQKGETIQSCKVVAHTIIGVVLGAQPGYVPPIIDKCPCIYHFLPPFAPPIFWFAHPIFWTRLRQCILYYHTASRG